MSVSRSSLRDYVEATAGTQVSDEALTRISGASQTAREALDELASQSLFDTEPAQLQTALDASAEAQPT